MSKQGQHGYTVHYIAVIRNGDGNVRHQRRGQSFELIPGKVAEAIQAAEASATENLVAFWCGGEKETPGHD